jgi:hypothetical protein
MFGAFAQGRTLLTGMKLTCSRTHALAGAFRFASTVRTCGRRESRHESRSRNFKVEVKGDGQGGWTWDSLVRTGTKEPVHRMAYRFSPGRVRWNIRAQLARLPGQYKQFEGGRNSFWHQSQVCALCENEAVARAICELLVRRRGTCRERIGGHLTYLRD